MISFKEVFCSELPSPSNIFHSCSKETVSRVSASSSSSSITSKNVGSNRANSSDDDTQHYHQFASEKHSLTLKTTTRSKSSVRELLVERLSNSDIKDAAAATTSATTCLANSALMLDYLQDKRLSIQVFALMNENHDNGNNNSHDESNISSSDTHNVGSGGGNIEKEKLQQQSTNSSSNSSMEQHHEKKGSTQDNNGMTTTTTAAASTISSSTASSTYSLMVKIQNINEKTLSNNHDNSTTKTKITERIYINFRPISVHVAQLYCTPSNQDADDHNDDGGDDDMSSSLMIVGIFVAGDDNKLHFYMTTLQVLRKRLQEGEGRGTESTATAPTCFQPSLIFEKIDPANIISSSDMSSGSEDDYFSKDDPLTFTTPIMAIESCISSKPPSHATSKDVQNRLAVSCYDGMVRILTYTVTSDEKSGSFRIAKIGCSSFIVDGPVASLHFGRRSDDVNTTQGKMHQTLYQDNLFLLAGSLCGLAFLFYEVPPSSTADASFDGPIVVVDGLHDADIEGGSEDCVTSVHTIRYHGETMLLVGTQGSRLLMFQQVLQNDSASDKKNTLNDEIENKRREMSQLLSERDRLRSKINDQCQKMSEIEKKDVEDVEVGGDNVEDDKNEDETNIEEGRTETESTSDTSKKERLIVMKSEVDELEQACLDCTDKISKLEASIDRLTVKLNDTPSPAQLVRKMHRYEFLWEHELPYPIQSIGSSVCERSGNLECFITTKHTVHVFRVLSMRMVDAAAALLERKFQHLP